MIPRNPVSGAPGYGSASLRKLLIQCRSITPQREGRLIHTAVKISELERNANYHLRLRLNALRIKLPKSHVQKDTRTICKHKTEVTAD
jgi:hypothetical protein